MRTSDRTDSRQQLAQQDPYPAEYGVHSVMAVHQCRYSMGLLHDYFYVASMFL